MKLLIWACLLCLTSSSVWGMFFELPDNAAASADEDDYIGEALNSINQYFGIQGAAVSTQPAPTSTITATASSGFLDEMETSLAHATNTLDDLWQQFRKVKQGLVGLMSGDNDGNTGADRLSVTTTNSLQKEVTSNALFATATAVSTSTKTTTTTAATTTIVTTPDALVSSTTTMRPPLP